VLGEAYADGRLTKEEYDERSDQAAGARTLGDLPALIRDLVPDRPATSQDLATPEQLDTQAVDRWRHQRREAVNGAIVVAVICWTIWALTGAGFPWPLIVMGGWGVGLIMNAYDVYGRAPISEADIAREIERLRTR
jgi:hypothetical protein